MNWRDWLVVAAAVLAYPAAGLIVLGMIHGCQGGL